MFSHGAISNANAYSTFIDRTMHELYLKDNKLHLVFDVKTTNNIGATELVNFINSPSQLIQLFNELTDSDFSKNELDIKLTLNSPGNVELILPILSGIVFTVVCAFIVGGNIKIKFAANKQTCNLNTDVNTDGLIEKILKFYQAIQDNQYRNKKEAIENSLNDSIQKLKIEIPKQISDSEES